MDSRNKSNSSMNQFFVRILSATEGPRDTPNEISGCVWRWRHQRWGAHSPPAKEWGPLEIPIAQCSPAGGSSMHNRHNSWGCLEITFRRAVRARNTSLPYCRHKGVLRNESTHWWCAMPGQAVIRIPNQGGHWGSQEDATQTSAEPDVNRRWFNCAGEANHRGSKACWL